MEIYVSEKELPDLRKNGTATLITMPEVSLYGNRPTYIEQHIKSLEQHDKELLKKFRFKIQQDIIKEFGNDLQKYIEENGYDDDTLKDFLKRRVRND